VRKGFLNEAEDASKRLIQAEIGDVHVVNVYIPNGSHVGSNKYEYKLDWLGKLRNHIAENHDLSKKVVLCGDFNIAPESKDCYNAEQIAGTIMVSDQERNALEEIKRLGFVDLYRMHNMNEAQYSWWDYRMGAFRRNLGYRIDHVWSSSELAGKCVNALIDKAPRKLERPSDHAPVMAEFA
jgi:exodeoxyribonuclease-3